VPVLLDHPRPVGSAGMTEAILAITYDPSIFSVSVSDITLGTIPARGAGWQLVSVVDQATGQLGIELYSTTPIAADEAGSLVNITFHVRGRARALAGARWGAGPRGALSTSVRLVDQVAPHDQEFATQVADVQGQFVLSR